MKINNNNKAIQLTLHFIIIVMLFILTQCSIAENDNNTQIHPKKERFEESQGVEKINDYRKIKIKHNVSFIFKGKQFSTNSTGMRDKEFKKAPESKVNRFLALGSSFVMGSGVADNEVFDQIIESMDSSNYIEIINAGCSTYDLIESIVQFENENLHDFNIKYLLIVSHGVDKQKNMVDLAYAIQNNIKLPFPYIKNILDTASLDLTKNDLHLQLKTVANDIITESYKYLYDKCKHYNIKPVWVYWPTTGMRPGMSLEYNEIKLTAEQIGYYIIDLNEMYTGIDKETLHVAPNDRHPNAKGHKIFAEALYPKLIELINKDL